MRGRWRAGAAIGLTALLLAAPAGASAATEVGSECAADGATGADGVVVAFTAPAGALPVSVPSAGVLTRWTFRMAFPEEGAPPAVGAKLKLLRPASTADTYQVIAESDNERVGNGTSSFPARIPVQAGDRIGLYTTVEGGGVIIFCKAEGNTLGYAPGEPTSGSTATFATAPVEAQAPISATIEPDADGDGYGDETQDGCPQSAMVQGPCPAVAVDSFALAKRNAIVVLVAVDNTAPVSVSGSAKLGKRGQAKLKAVTKTVTAGRITSFKLSLPGSLRKALRKLPRRRKLTVQLSASATNAAGQITTDGARLKLGSTAKRKPGRKRR